MTLFQDAFISYGRADSKAFAALLNQRLIDDGLTIWFDFDDIPLGVDYQKQIDDGIEKADNFLFLISPHSVNSPYCRLEVELALKLGKRIIPLLHVEEISRDTWQQRNPNGTHPEWQEYTEAGKHTSFANMHPAISKINWVYFREGQDNYEQGIQGLLTIFKRQQEYVNRHTVLLTQALEWEQNQKQTTFLLLGEERQTAETWLRQRFKTEQPPCVPTDLHCEFITESIKNANNMMTQIFLAHTPTDRAVMDQIRRSLHRQAITVWTNRTDIRTGDAFKTALSHGIEEADNVVYLLSPASLQCPYCTYELNHALSLNKRIIPILVSPVDSSQLPEALAPLRAIDLTDNVDADDYALDESELLNILQQDAAYYAQHKVLLVKALNWQRQEHNPSILLRGYDLSHAEAWLKTAQKRSLQAPTPLHQEFIQASLNQPPAPSIDVFISYSSSDGDLARKLNDALQVQGKTTWFDQESIAAGPADFQQELCRGIEMSDNIVFILSPRSVTSPYCAAEVEHAVKFNKRFITILYQSVDANALHPELAKVQWLDFRQQRGNFTTHFNHLIRTLDTDREHVKNHTKWLRRSLDWHQQNRNPDLLLRGTEYAIAHQWLQDATHHQKSPLVTTEQQSFITASQAAIETETRRQQRQNTILKSLLASVSVLFVAASVTGGIAFWQQQRLKLDEAANKARRSLITKPVEGLIDSLKLVQKSNATRQTIPSVQSSLRDAIGLIIERDRLEAHDGHDDTEAHDDAIWSAVFSPNGAYIASGGFDNTVRLWTKDGTLIQELQGHTDEIWSVVFSPDSQTLVSSSSDGTIRRWGVDGREIAPPIQTGQGHVKAIAFSPDGRLIASGGEDGTIRLWTWQGRPLGKPFQRNAKVIWSVAFSPDGTQIVGGGEDGIVRLWTVAGQLLATFSGHEGQVNAVAFSPDGRAIATGGADDTVRLFKLSPGTSDLTNNSTNNLTRNQANNSTNNQSSDQTNSILYRHDDDVMTVAFSPNGRWLVSGGDDNRLFLWDLQQQTLSPPLVGHQYYVYSVAFSPDGQRLISGSEDRTLRLWDVPSILARMPIRTNHRSVNALTVIPPQQPGQSPWLVSGGDSHPDRVPNGLPEAPTRTNDNLGFLEGRGTIQLWDWQGNPVSPLWWGHEASVLAIAASEDGQTIVSGDADGSLIIWSRQGTSRKIQSDDRGAINSIAIHPTQPLFANASDDGAVRLWDFEGNAKGLLFQEKEIAVNAIAFSPDGTILASGGTDDIVRLWDLQTGNELGQLGAQDGQQGHRDEVNAIAFSPDGQLLVSASRDQSLRLWSVTDRTEIVDHPFLGHTSTINAVAFSADGQTIVSGSRDQTLQVWDLEGNPIGSPLEGHEKSVRALAFSPDGQWLLSGGEDGSIQRWEGGSVSDWVRVGSDRIKDHSISDTRNRE